MGLILWKLGKSWTQCLHIVSEDAKLSANQCVERFFMRQEMLFEDQDFLDDRASSDPVFLLDIEGFSGPLDLLLELSKRQKVDLQRISILALADQYLAFIAEARDCRLDLAADYLVMAAWLAYLKSKLLLPRGQNDEEPDAGELAADLNRRLQALEEIRKAAHALQDLPMLGRDVFSRGNPEGIAVKPSLRWDVSIFDLLSAYATQRQKNALSQVTIGKRSVWPIPEARNALMQLIRDATDWTEIAPFLIELVADRDLYRSVRASSFSALLELVKEGFAEVRQELPYEPIWLKRTTNHRKENNS